MHHGDTMGWFIMCGRNEIIDGGKTSGVRMTPKYDLPRQEKGRLGKGGEKRVR